MKILIIGHSGYIGSRLTKVLKDSDLEVYTYGNRQDDYNLLTQEFLRKFNTIVLLAGHSSVPSCNGPLKGPWNNNVRNFANLADKLYTYQRLIYASSSSIYGNSGTKEYTESDTSLSYVNNYDLTKNILDQVAQTYISKGYNIVGLRFGTVCGPSDITRVDILLNMMVYNAVKTGTITVANKNIHRPYLSVNDLCKAIKTIVLSNNFVTGMYNLANGNYTINEYSLAVKHQLHAEIVDKGITPNVYDFKINTDKFKYTYGFEYEDSVQDIVDSLKYHYKLTNSGLVTRLEYFDYTG